MKKQIYLLVIAVVALLAACNSSQNKTPEAGKYSVSEKPFGVFENQDITQYTITNPSGMQVSIINYGGTVTNIMTPDKDKKLGDVVLGFDSLSGYLQKGNPYFGCLVGRYGNRIAKGKFILEKQNYQLTVNDHGNTLHGGLKGLDKVVWKASKPSGDSVHRKRGHEQ